ncbi:endonuclease/exonuclease/phosphatase family protein [Thermoactinospora rubra]|uniref:endonuclease/exonuclease/phosphatase family protein n=1 Tax=Thermoactinospora rubra TaxID=1088767 RepID=UPI001180ECBC
MTWNVCAGTNSACPLYRGGVHELGWRVARYAVGRPIKPDVIFLQEFCSGAGAPLERWLEELTGRPWSVSSWGLVAADGSPYACHPDYQGRDRGAQSVTVAVAQDAARFEAHPLSSPPWYVRRAALCAAYAGIRVCGTHLSSGRADDDRQPGAPYRTRQVEELLALKAGLLGGDLNLTPGHPALRGAYRTYRECDPRNRWTYTASGKTASGKAASRKLDYLFAARVKRCHLGPADAPSDHRPLYVLMEGP